MGLDKDVELAKKICELTMFGQPLHVNDILQDIKSFKAQEIQAAVQKERLKASEIIEQFVDDETCDYDHHGYCQTHGWMDESKCINQVANDYLTTKDTNE